MKQLTKEELAVLKAFDGPTICNAIEVFGLRSRTEGYMRPGMILRTGGREPIIGYAVTAKVGAHFASPDAHEKLMGYYEHVRENDGPTIAVIQDLDPDASAAFWGEVQATVHQSLGCVGTIMQGGVRDLKEVDAMGFTMFSTELNIAHGYTHVEQYACPVSVLGLDIYPGDLLFADVHGVVKIPQEILADLPAVCRKIADAELPMLTPCRAAIREGRKPTMQEIRAWREAMNEARKM